MKVSAILFLLNFCETFSKIKETDNINIVKMMTGQIGKFQRILLDCYSVETFQTSLP